MKFPEHRDQDTNQQRSGRDGLRGLKARNNEGPWLQSQGNLGLNLKNILFIVILTN